MRAAAYLVVVLLGCDGGDEGAEPFVRDPSLDDVVLTSRLEASSHEAGENCMACHGPNGEGPGRFTFAGTVYAGVRAEMASGLALDHEDSDDTDGGHDHGAHGAAFLPGDGSGLAGAVVELRTGPFGGGELRHTLVADASGSFYTTEAIDFFGEALFPTVYDAERVDFLGMPFPTNSGACNMCHHVGGLTLYLE